MQVISGKEAEQILTVSKAREANKLAYRLFSDGRCRTPQRLNIATEDKTGNFLIMPSYCPDLGLVSIKNINLFPGNPQKGKQTSYAQILLIDATDGQCLAVIDGDAVTRLRTAAATGVALEVLANPKCQKAALFGTGYQAEAQLAALLDVCHVDEIAVCGRKEKKTEAFAEEMSEKFQVHITPYTSGADAADGADIIVTATTASDALFPEEAVKRGCTISCIGNYYPDQTELPLELFRRVDRVYYDSESAVLEESGELILGLKQGFLKRSAMKGEIGLLLDGKVDGRQSEDEIIVFKSVGIGIQDLTAAKIICQK